MSQLPQPRDKHAQRMRRLTQIVRGSRQKAALGQRGLLGFLRLVAQVPRGIGHALFQQITASLQGLHHLVEAELQFSQWVMGRFWPASRQVALANAFDHARHAHHRLNENAGQVQGQQAAQQQAGQGDRGAGQQGVGTPLDQPVVGKLQPHLAQQTGYR